MAAVAGNGTTKGVNHDTSNYRGLLPCGRPVEFRCADRVDGPWTAHTPRRPPPAPTTPPPDAHYSGADVVAALSPPAVLLRDALRATTGGLILIWLRVPSGGLILIWLRVSHTPGLLPAVVGRPTDSESLPRLHGGL